MIQAAENVLELVGNTPLVKLHTLGRHVKANIYLKLEYLNPGSSVKDRPAMKMIEDAEKSGELVPGGTIVEATSGNTGMGLAMASAIKGYKCIFVMPDKMSDEKIKSLRAMGAKVVVCPTAVEPEDPRSYYNVAIRLAEESPGGFLANQYHNQSNPAAHYASTGPEIWEQTGGEIDAFVCAIGTGGTISGTGKYLKEQNPKVQIVAVDPVGSIYYDYFKTGKMTDAFSYMIEGLGEDFLPSHMDFQYVDDVVAVLDDLGGHLVVLGLQAQRHHDRHRQPGGDGRRADIGEDGEEGDERNQSQLPGSEADYRNFAGREAMDRTEGQIGDATGRRSPTSARPCSRRRRRSGR